VFNYKSFQFVLTLPCVSGMTREHLVRPTVDTVFRYQNQWSSQLGALSTVSIKGFTADKKSKITRMCGRLGSSGAGACPFQRGITQMERITPGEAPTKSSMIHLEIRSPNSQRWVVFDIKSPLKWVLRLFIFFVHSHSTYCHLRRRRADGTQNHQ
jgi:hypothetical protein